MGEMADYYNEQIENMEYLRSMYQRGEMHHDEAYESGIIDELGYELLGNKTIRCRCCGKSGLHWRQRDRKWRLFDNRGIHVCKINPLNDGKEIQ